MAFTLNLEIRGLCAFIPAEEVPLQPGAGAFKISRMRALIQDARTGSEVEGQTICPHHPKLRVEQPMGPDQVFQLSGHRIEINTGPLADDQKGLSLQLSFWSVANMGIINPAYAVDDGFLVQPPTLTGLVASVPLLAGSVEGIDPSPVTVGFPGTTYVDNFARAVRVQVPITGSSGSFTLTPLTGGTSTVMTFTPKPGHTSVDATISNLCDPNEAAPGKDVDSDFALYYLLDPDFGGPYLVPEPQPGQGRKRGEVNGEAIDVTFSCNPLHAPFNSLA